MNFNFIRSKFLWNLILSVLVGFVTVFVTAVGSGILEVLVGLFTGREHDFYPEPFWGAFWGSQVIFWVLDFGKERLGSNSETKSAG